MSGCPARGMAVPMSGWMSAYTVSMGSPGRPHAYSVSGGPEIFREYSTGYSFIMDAKRYPELTRVLADADKENKKVPCAKCGKEFQPYWLKDGVCNGCRNPNAIVPAKPASGAAGEPRRQDLSGTYVDTADKTFVLRKEGNGYRMVFQGGSRHSFVEYVDAERLVKHSKKID